MAQISKFPEKSEMSLHGKSSKRYASKKNHLFFGPILFRSLIGRGQAGLKFL